MPACPFRPVCSIRPERRPAPPPSTVLGVAAVVVLTAACGGADVGPDLPTAMVRDSAGVTIVENAPVPPDAGVWSLGPAPSLEIGVLDGDAAYQLFGVQGAIRLEDERIVVANRGTGELRVFDASGGHTATWGGEGEGPGEFLAIQSIARWRGDSVAVWDGRTRRLTLYSSEGQLGRSFALPAIEGMGAPAFAGVSDGGRMVVQAPRLTPVSGGAVTGLQRPDVHLAVVDADGALLADLGLHPGQERYLNIGERSMEVYRLPWGPGFVLATPGSEVIMAPTEHFELPFRSVDGTLTRIVRLAEARRAFTAEAREAHLRQRLDAVPEERRPDVRAGFDRIPVPDSLPALSSLLVDAEDHLWVQLFHLPDADATARWIVMDPTGQAVASLELPGDLVLLDVGVDYVIARATDDLGVEKVQVWPLRRGP